MPALARSSSLAQGSALALLLTAVACDRDADERPARPAAPSRSPEAPPAPQALPAASASAAPATLPPPTCPSGMQIVPGGAIWIGSDPSEHYSADESPRFRTQLATFCMDEVEVTVAAYRGCVERGECSKPKDKQFHCNFRYADRGEHPINCVDWTQANGYCRAQSKRLPSEREWEYAARGGERAFEYSWGNEHPDGRTCWKRPHSCAVKSFAPGAFGLFDMTGNVWEWTADYYGPYPWPPASGFSRVYRGGSWSRRFEKWMHTRLRNRDAERFSGSHLGFRCALTPAGISCPFGTDEQGQCRAGVLERPCDAPRVWNGARCARPGEARCREGWSERPGHGCVPAEEAALETVDLAAEKAGVTRARTPELDVDCRQNFRDRPHAFRYSGGTHRGRNLVSRSAGCKNRDVGVGFNSTCCP